VAHTLGQLLRPLRGRCHVNLIPLNPTGSFEGRPTDPSSLKAFVKVLDERHGITATARVRRGIDIDAGCGQLTQARKRQDDKAAAKRLGQAATMAGNSAAPPEASVAGGWGASE